MGDTARTILGWAGIWCLASLFLGCLWALIGWRSNSAPKQDFDWPGHSFRIIDLPETEYERAEAIQKAARNVG